MELIDFGLEELTAVDDEIIIQTSFDDYGKMQSAFEEKNWTVNNTELQKNSCGYYYFIFRRCTICFEIN